MKCELSDKLQQYQTISELLHFLAWKVLKTETTS